MQCPTCGRRVRKGQDTCAFCGAFVSNSYLREAGGGLIIPPDLAKQAAQPQPHRGFPKEPAEPDLSDLDDLPGMPGGEDIEDALPEEQPSRSRPEAPPAERPKYAGLLRILFPLIFILIPLFNLLVRNSPFSPDEGPVLQETQFFENVAAGQFSDPQTVFSRNRHERVVLVARWSGSRGRHEYTFRWVTPEGNVLPDTSSVTRFQFGRGDEAFSAYALLPLNAGLPLGMWRVEVAVDGEVQAQPTFELRE